MLVRNQLFANQNLGFIFTKIYFASVIPFNFSKSSLLPLKHLYFLFRAYSFAISSTMSFPALPLCPSTRTSFILCFSFIFSKYLSISIQISLFKTCFLFTVFHPFFFQL